MIVEKVICGYKFSQCTSTFQLDFFVAYISL